MISLTVSNYNTHHRFIMTKTNSNIVEVVRLDKALELLGCQRTKFFTTYSKQIRQFQDGRFKVFYLEDIKKLSNSSKPTNFKIVD